MKRLQLERILNLGIRTPSVDGDQDSRHKRESCSCSVDYDMML